MEWLLERLSEASTWRGLTVVLASVGMNISPELSNQIISLAVALFGLIEVVRKERG